MSKWNDPSSLPPLRRTCVWQLLAFVTNPPKLAAGRKLPNSDDVLYTVPILVSCAGLAQAILVVSAGGVVLYCTVLRRAFTTPTPTPTHPHHHSSRLASDDTRFDHKLKQTPFGPSPPPRFCFSPLLFVV